MAEMMGDHNGHTSYDVDTRVKNKYEAPVFACTDTCIESITQKKLVMAPNG